MSELIDIIILSNDEEIIKTVAIGVEYNIATNGKLIKYADSGEVHKGRHLYIPVKSEIEKVFDMGETIQYKSDDIDCWIDFIPLSDNDYPTFANNLQWRIKQ